MRKPIPLEELPCRLPAPVARLIEDADLRGERFFHDRRDTPVATFVPSDYVLVHQALVAIERLNLSAGQRFVDWGSGLGVPTCIAAMLGWDAVGIEIENDLVESAIALAEDHGVECEFVCASFVPSDMQRLIDSTGDINWVQPGGDDAYELLDLEIDDFDLVFCYPWPGEEAVVESLFDRRAAVGALLLTFHGQDGVKLQRKAK